jgi:hypothetical protein
MINFVNVEINPNLQYSLCILDFVETYFWNIIEFF